MELHCDLVPKTCHNFIGLCKTGSYDSTSRYAMNDTFRCRECCVPAVFHRSIKNFMASWLTLYVDVYLCGRDRLFRFRFKVVTLLVQEKVRVLLYHYDRYLSYHRRPVDVE